MASNETHADTTATVVLPRTVLDPAYRALKEVVPWFTPSSIHFEFKTAAESLDEDKQRIGLVVITEPDSFFEDFLVLNEAGCRQIVVIMTRGSGDPWARLEVTDAACFVECSHQATVRVPDIVAKLMTAAQATNGAQSQTKRCIRVAKARRLAKQLRGFLHGGGSDIANAMLAPARMLCMAHPTKEGDRRLEKIWEQWEEASRVKRLHIATRLNDFCRGGSEADPEEQIGELRGEIVASWTQISEWLGGDNPDLKRSRDLEVLAITRLMGLLTDLRMLSGLEPDDPTVSAPQPPRCVAGAELTGDPAQILVIDDYADCWKPVLQLVAERLSSELGRPVHIDFCTDPNPAGKAPNDLMRVLPEYDLVLLDIYLPNKNGLKLLGEIRERLAWLPVIMWTTSLDARCASQASLSNGYIFKKTATCDEMVDTIRPWLELGQSRRRFSLPNPFFDHIIRTPDLRECALAFTHWCLKYLDSFHALDNHYFKFFNDHGGRHIVGLLNILEHLLRPVLFDDTVFASDMEMREREVLAIYLAVLCHEFGMFPIGESTDFAEHDQKKLYKIRDLHAIKSFLVLMEPPKDQEDLVQLIEDLKYLDGGGVRAWTAMICAYHSRLLSLEDFCLPIAMTEEKEELLKSINETEFATHLANAAGYAKDQQRGRLVRLCALFRFADSLDIDRTRVPADFILCHPARSAKQDAEDLKRLVVEKLVIDRGKIHIEFRATIPTEWYCQTQLVNPYSASVNIASGVSSTKQIVNLLSKPHPTVEKANKQLDKWLENHFENPVDANNNASDDDLARVAAMSVLCDLQEEYQAIEIPDVKLDDVIRFGEVSWTGGANQISLLKHRKDLRKPDYEI